MCGIAGIVSLIDGPPITADEVARMLPALRHRGPDGTGVHVEDGIGLGHTRLSIIDIAGGAQPLSNEDGTVWTTFNGEIFNYVELRAELQAHGHVFRTQTDTEVLVHGYEQWGDAFVDRLNGQFALALWDARRRRLVLLRDRPGILPLVYAQFAGRLYFASEAKALLALFPASPALDPIALDQLFTGWAPVSPRTVFAGVSEVPPGHRVVVQRGRVSCRPYWQWEYPSQGDYDTRSEPALREELEALLAHATRLRLRADVPVGAYLSGGLDSSALAALIRRHSAAPLRTFSIAFASEEFDERAHQDALVRHLGVDHHRRECTLDDIGRGFSETVRYAESPMLRTAPVPMQLLSEAVRGQGYRVVLTGEGADEVFGGYDLFKEAKLRRFWSRHPESEKRPLLLQRLYPWMPAADAQGMAYLRAFYGIGLDAPEHPLFSHLPRFRTTAQAKRFYSQAFSAQMRDDAEAAFAALVPAEAGAWDPFDRAQQLEARTLMSGYLLSVQGDRMLMAHSVEGRFPYLDHRVIAFAARLDPRLKMRVLTEKYLLREAMRAYLPPSLQRRPKQPYRAPDIPALLGAASEAMVGELLAPAAIRETGYFDADRVALLLAKARRGAATSFRDRSAFVGILSTQLWHHHFVTHFADWRPAARDVHLLAIGSV